MPNKNTKSAYQCFSEKGIKVGNAIRTIERELEEDGLTSHDLGSYTTIDMLPETDLLIRKSAGKNIVNQNEYPKTTSIHDKMVKTVAELLHAPDMSRVFGSSTAGSSEAIFLAILAAKWRWKKRNEKGDPNIVLCSNAHLCWYKFSKYLDIEVREVPLEHYNAYPMEAIVKQVDSDTITVVSIFGCTETGTCDPIFELNKMLETINETYDWDIGIHVDAAIGGFIAPFLEPSIYGLWNFKCSLVRSINISGHKFGLVYPGLGWILFRDKNYFESELRLKSKYLCGDSESFTVNFSRSSSLVIAQYFNFLHYGREGYRRIIGKCMANTKFFSELLINTGLFEILSEGKIPVVVFKFLDTIPIDNQKYTKLLREKQWMLPYYKLSSKDDFTVMRVVVRNDMEKNFLQELAQDLVDCYRTLNN